MLPGFAVGASSHSSVFFPSERFSFPREGATTAGAAVASRLGRCLEAPSLSLRFCLDLGLLNVGSPLTLFSASIGSALTLCWVTGETIRRPRRAVSRIPAARRSAKARFTVASLHPSLSASFRAEKKQYPPRLLGSVHCTIAHASARARGCSWSSKSHGRGKRKTRSSGLLFRGAVLDKLTARFAERGRCT